MLSILPVAPFSTRAFAQYWQWYGVNNHSAINTIRSNSHPASLDLVTSARRTGRLEVHYDSERLEIQGGACLAVFSLPRVCEYPLNSAVRFGMIATSIMVTAACRIISLDRFM